MRRIASNGILVLALCAPAAAVAEAARCGDTPVTTAAASAAIDQVERALEESHVGSAQGVAAETRAGLRRARESTRSGTTERELVVALNRALVPLRDAHLVVLMNDEAARTCPRLPTRFEWNGAGLWLEEGAGGLPAGSRIVSIGSRTVGEIEDELRRLIPHEVPQWVRAEGAQWLVRSDTLATLGVLGQDGTVELSAVRPDGSSRKVSLGLIRPAGPVTAKPWVGYRIFAAQRTGWFWFDRFDYDEELSRQLDAFLEAAERAGVTKVAIDIRGNPGGDSSVAIALLDAMRFESYQVFSVELRPSPDLAEAIPSLMPAAVNPIFEQAGIPPVPAHAATYFLPPPLVLAQLRARVTAHPLRNSLTRKPALYLLTDAGTFSSATLFAAIVRDNQLGMLVGEAPGNSATFNGTEHRVPLAGLPYYLKLTLARLHRPDHAAADGASIQPEVVVPVTGADLAEGRDRALGYVLAAP